MFRNSLLPLRPALCGLLYGALRRSLNSSLHSSAATRRSTRRGLSTVAFVVVATFNPAIIPSFNVSALSDTQIVTTRSGAAPYAGKSKFDIPAMAYIEHNEVYNPESVIPPQCYTKTDGNKNPCYACHQTYRDDKSRPNAMHDGDLQGEYQFSELGETNHWKNLFVDRRQLIDGISDEFIQQWVEQDNYSAFVDKFKQDQTWRGEVTPIENLAYPEHAFDKLGVAKDGSHWVAFNYKPFPSTFWPTNGSTGDVMIRLGAEFRERNGKYSQDVYFANLALVEMTMKDLPEITLPPVSEIAIGTDINGDGEQSARVTLIKRRTHYLGDASKQTLEYMLYPAHTEMLHTVRYIGTDSNGNIYNAPRMKEVRYMKKHNFKSKAALASEYYLETKDKHFEKLPQILHIGDRGINNKFGWTINAYIEDENGELRHQHKQELAFCSGCHKSIGATFDQTFSFVRKVDGAAGWGYIDLTAMQDAPNTGEQDGEILTYLQRVGGGDEFRQNKEMLRKWFNPDGSVDRQKVQNAKNLYELITPSVERAMALNKAYYTIVKEQSYLYGRDATIIEATNVLEKVDASQAPLESAHRYQWDMRLNWQQQALHMPDVAENKTKAAPAGGRQAR